MTIFPVARLKETINFLNKKSQAQFEELRDFVSPESKYLTYRNEIQSKEGPCIPFFGYYLYELTYIEEGKDNLENGLINFSKKHKWQK